ncbi:MAG: ribonuclease R [Melioribacteraceae bacterium]|nr:ribonuclease R [Melioribacteraceae bacterium]MCF8264045.1 ribonuclease R [Melioribacteraceae bacterium]MCF8431490.1 ribonuclease R [Melioribacteraceae bacterium]
MKKEIKAFFNSHPSLKIKTRELANRLDIETNYEYAELKAVLHKMTKEGILERQGKRFVLANQDFGNLEGKLEILDDGSFGFVNLNDSTIKDVFIAERNLGTALHGDRVKVELFAKKKGKNPEGQIIEVLERGKKEIVGTLKKTKAFYFVIPDDKKMHRDIYIPKNLLNGATPNDKVVVSGIEWESKLLNPEGEIIEILGKSGSYETEINSIAKEFNVDVDFPASVLEEVSLIPDTISDKEIAKRIDLRDEDIFTIDPDDAKDFDDAVSVEVLNNGNYSVGIHIADVSHYIPQKSNLYKEAFKRATSIYLVGKVIPMLPEKLSNNICSLVPNQDRLTYSVIAELTPQCSIVNYKIKKSVINSKRRFTYDEVQEILTKNEGDFFDKLKLLNKISRTLKKKRNQSGSINFHTSEVVFKLDESGFPVTAGVKELKESHSLIEELMLLANKLVATHINKSRDPQSFVYRIHDVPDPEKLNEFSNFVKTLGYNFDKNNAARPKEFQQLLTSAEHKPEEALLNEIAIRSMAKAVYSTHNIGHYGLAFKYYSHFTSPIRRFPDLIVHKLIYNYIENDSSEKFGIKDLDKICDQCSAQERNAVNAERLSIKLKQIELLSNKIGEEFFAIISGITNFGIFVKLSESLAEGLIKIRDLDDDYYLYDEKKYQLKGRSTGKIYRLGDKVEVKLIRADIEKREIDFVLLKE